MITVQQHYMKALGMMVVIFGSLVRNECKKKQGQNVFLKKTKLNTRLAITQRADLFGVNIFG